MRVTAVCVTWNRPQLLGRAIHCFEAQENEDARLFVLDDAGQYNSLVFGDGWVLASVPQRYPNLGYKRNMAVEMARKWFPETEAILTWDDDDVYWPHAVASVATALEKKPWAQPRLVYEPAVQDGGEALMCVHADRPVGIGSLAHGGSWAWRLDLFDAAGGYPNQDNGEDGMLAAKAEEWHGPSANSSAMGPWYWYNRRDGEMMCDLGRDVWAIRGRQEIKKISCPPIGWNGPDIYAMPKIPRIHERPF